MEQGDIKTIIKGLTKARRNMIRHGGSGYGDCDCTMDGPGRRMLYALVESGLFRPTNKMNHPEDRHTSASYVLTKMGRQVRDALIALEAK